VVKAEKSGKSGKSEELEFGILKLAK